MFKVHFGQTKTHSPSSHCEAVVALPQGGLSPRRAAV